MPLIKGPSIRIVLCREDFPLNLDWKKYGYPKPYCWGLLELYHKAQFSEDLRRFERRIRWELYWRLHKRYSGKHEFPKVYLCGPEGCMPIEEAFPFFKDRELLTKYLYRLMISAAYTFGLISKRREEEKVPAS